jgi:transposase
MIQVPASANVVLMHEPVSFRNGINGMVAIARTVLHKEPMDGAIFVFRNRRRQMLRVLFYDGSGFWLVSVRWGASRRCWSEDEMVADAGEGLGVFAGGLPGVWEQLRSVS